MWRMSQLNEVLRHTYTSEETGKSCTLIVINLMLSPPSYQRTTEMITAPISTLEEQMRGASGDYN